MFIFVIDRQTEARLVKGHIWMRKPQQKQRRQQKCDICYQMFLESFLLTFNLNLYTQWIGEEYCYVMCYLSYSWYKNRVTFGISNYNPTIWTLQFIFLQRSTSSVRNGARPSGAKVSTTRSRQWAPPPPPPARATHTHTHTHPNRRRSGWDKNIN
jgi:hypothetical protein